MFNFFFNVLVGDVDANGTANVQDSTAVRTAITNSVGTTTTASTFRLDIDGSNRLNVQDITQVKTALIRSLGTTLVSLTATPTAPVATAATIGSPTTANVTSSGARLGATVTGNGGEPVLERGVVLLAGSTGTPVVTDPAAITLLSAGGVGTFTVDFAGLMPSTAYRFRAIVRTSQGLVYGDVTEFTTSALPG
jgi:hypothetical protein